MSTATTRIDAREGPAPDRRVILACGILLLACLGTVYAWSYFTRQLGETYGWNKMQIGGVFSLAVAGLGLSAAYTGPLVASVVTPGLNTGAAYVMARGRRRRRPSRRRRRRRCSSSLACTSGR